MRRKTKFLRENNERFIEADQPRTFVLNGFWHQIEFDVGKFPAEFEVSSEEGINYLERRQVTGQGIFLPRYPCMAATIKDRANAQIPVYLDRLYFKNKRVVVKVYSGQLLDIKFIMSEV